MWRRGQPHLGVPHLSPHSLGRVSCTARPGYGESHGILSKPPQTRAEPLTPGPGDPISLREVQCEWSQMGLS